MRYDFANIEVRPFLTLSDINNKWIFGDTKHVINVSTYREPEVIDTIIAKGATYDWLPTEETPMNVDAILKAVQTLCQYDRDGSHILVHCMGGNNRSRTVVEAFYFAKYCQHFEDEYKGCKNHLIWNCQQGYLPPLPEMEHMLRRYTPRPYSVETYDEIEGITISGITPLSEEEWRVFNDFDKEYPHKTVSELLKLTFEKTGRYEFDEKERKLHEKPHKEQTIEERAKEIIDGYAGFLVLIYEHSKSKFPILDNLYANPACCECGSFPSNVFTLTEKLQLIREEHALFPSEADKEKFDNQLKDFIHEHIRAIGRTGLCMLDEVGKDREKPLDFPTWYEQEIYESLFSRDDWYELLQKVEDYTMQINGDSE